MVASRAWGVAVWSRWARADELVVALETICIAHAWSMIGILQNGQHASGGIALMGWWRSNVRSESGAV
jgi:hypothetical protein